MFLILHPEGDVNTTVRRKFEYYNWLCIVSLYILLDEGFGRYYNFILLTIYSTIDRWIEKNSYSTCYKRSNVVLHDYDSV